MDIQDILKQLEVNDGTFPREAVVQAIEQRELIVRIGKTNGILSPAPPERNPENTPGASSRPPLAGAGGGSGGGKRRLEHPDLHVQTAHCRATPSCEPLRQAAVERARQKWC
jgi:hypothetical protein